MLCHQTIIKCLVHYQFLDANQKQHHKNISSEEFEAMKILKKEQQNGNIVIYPADKGGGWVVMDMADYIEEMKSQLTATFKCDDGTVKPFYEKSSQAELNQ